MEGDTRILSLSFIFKSISQVHSTSHSLESVFEATLLKFELINSLNNEVHLHPPAHRDPSRLFSSTKQRLRYLPTHSTLFLTGTHKLTTSSSRKTS